MSNSDNNTKIFHRKVNLYYSLKTFLELNYNKDFEYSKVICGYVSYIADNIIDFFLLISNNEKSVNLNYLLKKHFGKKKVQTLKK